MNERMDFKTTNKLCFQDYHFKVNLNDMLGKGSSGNVFFGVLIPERIPAAVKIYEEEMDEFPIQKKAFKRFPQFVAKPFYRKNKHPFKIIVMEFGEYSFLTYRNNSNDKEYFNELLTIVLNYEWLNRLGVLHRDSRGKNIMKKNSGEFFSENFRNPEENSWMLIDFGWSEIIDHINIDGFDSFYFLISEALVPANKNLKHNLKQLILKYYNIIKQNRSLRRLLCSNLFPEDHELYYTEGLLLYIEIADSYDNFIPTWRHDLCI